MLFIVGANVSLSLSLRPSLLFFLFFHSSLAASPSSLKRYLDSVIYNEAPVSFGTREFHERVYVARVSPSSSIRLYLYFFAFEKLQRTRGLSRTLRMELNARQKAGGGRGNRDSTRCSLVFENYLQIAEGFAFRIGTAFPLRIRVQVGVSSEYSSRIIISCDDGSGQFNSSFRQQANFLLLKNRT